MSTIYIAEGFCIGYDLVLTLDTLLDEDFEKACANATTNRSQELESLFNQFQSLNLLETTWKRQVLLLLWNDWQHTCGDYCCNPVAWTLLVFTQCVVCKALHNRLMTTAVFGRQCSGSVTMTAISRLFKLFQVYSRIETGWIDFQAPESC